MSKETFFDIAPLTQHFTMRKKDSNGSPVLISKANWLNFGEGEDDGALVSHPGEYWMKSSFSSEEVWQKVCILKGRRKLPPPGQIAFPIKYPVAIPSIRRKLVSFKQWLLTFLHRLGPFILLYIYH